MHYGTIGEGKPVILLHGSMVADPWDGFERLLASHYRVYLPHLPGFGLSTPVPGVLHTTDLFTECLQAFIREAGLDTAPVIALSLGTVVALKAIGGQYRNPLILVGMPLAVQGKMLSLMMHVPVLIRRALCRTKWGKHRILIPILMDIIGKADGGSKQDLMSALEDTHPCAIVDMDPFQEINRCIPSLTSQDSRTRIFLYGDRDPLYQLAKNRIDPVTLIPDADHNAFASNPRETLRVIRQSLSLFVK